jgi:hypothetical protein
MDTSVALWVDIRSLDLAEVFREHLCHMPRSASGFQAYLGFHPLLSAKNVLYERPCRPRWRWEVIQAVLRLYALRHHCVRRVLLFRHFFPGGHASPGWTPSALPIGLMAAGSLIDELGFAATGTL